MGGPVRAWAGVSEKFSMDPADSGQNPDPGRLKRNWDESASEKDYEMQLTGGVVWIGVGVNSSCLG